MEEKLLSATRGKLEKNGTLGHLRSELEHEILGLLGMTDGLKRAQKENIALQIADELVADYLEWVGYSFSSAIFNSESSIRNSSGKIDRSRTIQMLGLGEMVDDCLPLLCQLIRKARQKGNE